MAGYGDKPFGLRDLKVTNIGGSTQVDLPNGLTLTFKEVLTQGSLRGDDALAAVVAITDSAEWSIEAGGISLEALAIMTGRTNTAAGTTPNRTLTMAANAGDNMPYFKIYGKSVGDVSTDDIHVKLNKVKLTSGIEGEFKDGGFFMTKCSGIAIDPGAGAIYEIVQNETAATLPTS
ncbi:MAG: hypothetical protein AB7R40_22565 [Nitrospiraceae bacterium]